MMVDSSGPSLPRRYNTVGLQNLGDTEGWGDEGDGVHVFELREGIYYRARIPGNTPIKWLLNFELRNPYVYAGGKHMLRKWQNRGLALASLIPTRGRVELRSLPEVGYVLTAKRSKSGRGGARLRLVSEFTYDIATKVPDDCTMVFQIVLGSPPESPLILVSGIKISWGDDIAETELVTIFVRNPKGKAERIYTTTAGVRVTITGDIRLNELYLYTPGFAIKKFLFVEALPDISKIEAYLNGS